MASTKRWPRNTPSFLGIPWRAVARLLGRGVPRAEQDGSGRDRGCDELREHGNYPRRRIWLQVPIGTPPFAAVFLLGPRATVVVLSAVGCGWKVDDSGMAP